MNKNENDRIQYTAADINRYLRGDMSSAEMYEIEKAALEDPFLADAIEGYKERMAFSENIVTNELDELKARMKTRIEPGVEKMKNSTRWWRIAALLLILAGAGSIIYKMVSTANLQEKSVITKNESAIQDSVPASAAENKIAPFDTASVALKEKADNTKTIDIVNTNRAIKKSGKAALPITPSPSLSNSPADIQHTEKPSQSLKFDSANVAAVMAPRPTAREEEAPVAENRSVLRKISPNETVNRQKTSKSDAASDEAVSIKEPEAEPKIGFAEYNKYIEENKKSVTLANRPHGDVVISFFVNKNGRLSNFNIEKSVSQTIDKEAIRLLKKGPAWKVLKNRKAKVEYTITF